MADESPFDFKGVTSALLGVDPVGVAISTLRGLPEIMNIAIGGAVALAAAPMVIPELAI